MLNSQAMKMSGRFSAYEFVSTLCCDIGWWPLWIPNPKANGNTKSTIYYSAWACWIIFTVVVYGSWDQWTTSMVLLLISLHQISVLINRFVVVTQFPLHANVKRSEQLTGFRLTSVSPWFCSELLQSYLYHAFVKLWLKEWPIRFQAATAALITVLQHAMNLFHYNELVTIIAIDFSQAFDTKCRSGLLALPVFFLC